MYIQSRRDLERKVPEYSCPYVNTSISRLADLLTSAENSLEEMTEEKTVEGLVSAISSHRAYLTDMIATANSLEDSLEDVRSINSDLRECCGQLIDDYLELAEDYEDKEGEISRLEKANEQLEDDVKDLIAERSSLESANGDLESDVEDLTAEVADLKARILELETSLEDSSQDRGHRTRESCL